MNSSWVEVDWSIRWLPTDDQREHSLQQLRFLPVPVTAGPVLEVVDIFGSLLTNGGAYVAVSDVVDGDEVAAWFLSRNRDEYRLADRLISSAGFAAAMPAIAGPGLTNVPGFSRSQALVLDGTLARALQWGGAYSDQPAMPGSKAKALGSAFCASVFGDRYDDMDVDESSARWSNWFKGVAWDNTWVVTDKRRRRVTVLCITDTIDVTAQLVASTTVPSRRDAPDRFRFVPWGAVDAAS